MEGLEIPFCRSLRPRGRSLYSSSSGVRPRLGVLLVPSPGTLARPTLTGLPAPARLYPLRPTLPFPPDFRARHIRPRTLTATGLYIPSPASPSHSTRPPCRPHHPRASGLHISENLTQIRCARASTLLFPRALTYRRSGRRRHAQNPHVGTTPPHRVWVREVPAVPFAPRHACFESQPPLDGDGDE